MNNSSQQLQNVTDAFHKDKAQSLPAPVLLAPKALAKTR